MGVYGGTTSISGGSLTGYPGISLVSGTVSIYGCGLTLSGGHLVGTLRDGTLINTLTSGLTEANLIDQC